MSHKRNEALRHVQHSMHHVIAAGEGSDRAPDSCKLCPYYRPDFKFRTCLYAHCPYKKQVNVFRSTPEKWDILYIIMAVFDVTQQVVANSSGIISGNTRVNDIGLSMLQSSLMQMDVGPLFGLFLQSFFIGITMRILSIVIFVIVYGRMIEIYMMVSLAPVPMATWGNHEQSHVGQNYLRSLFALGFQGFLILICVAIYAVLLQNVAISGDAINSIWSIVGYTVLLCFSLFKTSSVAKTLLGAH